jgi:hypothetical protein
MAGFALSGEVLFFGHQRKVPKRKVARRLARDAGTLRVSAKPALARLAISLPLDSLRHGLACPGFPCDARLRQR